MKNKLLASLLKPGPTGPCLCKSAQTVVSCTVCTKREVCTIKSNPSFVTLKFQEHRQKHILNTGRKIKKRNFRTAHQNGRPRDPAHVEVYEMVRPVVLLNPLCDATAPQLCHLQISRCFAILRPVQVNMVLLCSYRLSKEREPPISPM